MGFQKIIKNQTLACKVAENKKKVEDNELQMILDLSKNDTVMYEDLSQDSESDLILKEEEDARQLKEVIQMSKDDELFHIQEEEESLRIAMMESMNACKVAENKKKVEDNELQMILALSKNDTVMYEDLPKDSYETMIREAKELLQECWCFLAKSKHTTIGAHIPLTI